MIKSKLTILTLTLLVFGLVVSGCVLSKQTSRQSDKQVSGQEVNQNVGQNVKTPEVEKSEDLSSEDLTQDDEIDISNWKTYRNKKYGFEFKYPEDWWVSFEYDANLLELEVADKFLLYRFEISVIQKDIDIPTPSYFNKIIDMGDYNILVQSQNSDSLNLKDINKMNNVIETIYTY